MNLEGIAALVAGGASGLGRATATELAAGGARVVVLDLSEPTDLEAHDRAPSFVRGDVRDERDVATAVAAAAAEGPLRVAVNCAGIGSPQRILRGGEPQPLADFRATVEVNLLGTFNVMRLSAAAIAATEPDRGERGVLVNTSSIAAFDGQLGQAAYAASKAGVAGLTLPAARELADHLIRVVAIAPGLFDTPLFGELPTSVRSRLADSVPHPRRLGDPREFAALVRHAIENPMLNGEVIRLDGGIRMP